MEKLQRVLDMVKTCLEKDEYARNDDMRLFLDVCKMNGCDMSVSAEQMLLEHNKMNIPNYESVRRCRQKIQASGLYRPNEYVQSCRNKLEKEYREFA